MTTEQKKIVLEALEIGEEAVIDEKLSVQHRVGRMNNYMDEEIQTIKHAIEIVKEDE